VAKIYAIYCENLSANKSNYKVSKLFKIEITVLIEVDIRIFPGVIIELARRLQSDWHEHDRDDNRSPTISPPCAGALDAFRRLAANRGEFHARHLESR
jgi:hypothetical protein